MSKLVLFLFLGVCVMAVHMEAVGNDSSDDDADLEELINKLEPELKAEFLASDPRINWKKVWSKAKPILKKVGQVAKPIAIEVGKAAAGAAAGAIVG